MTESTILRLLNHELRTSGHNTAHISPAAAALCQVLDHQLAIRDQHHADMQKQISDLKAKQHQADTRSDQE